MSKKSTVWPRRCRNSLQQSLGWSDHGFKRGVRRVLMILCFAARRLASIADACRRLLLVGIALVPRNLWFYPP